MGQVFISLVKLSILLQYNHINFMDLIPFDVLCLAEGLLHASNRSPDAPAWQRFMLDLDLKS